ncbi:MAG: N-acetylglucosamine-6-phosphate deacetylase [Ignavibacterium sp.]|nr:MAG: N-acetylglucosamine-6-phosphate deacetylase [Ignavibacterium sp.]
MQVNGYAGVDFNSLNLTDEQLHIACKKLVEDNVEGILATIITDDFDAMLKKIKNLVKLIRQDNFVRSVIRGIHIEGPFLNPEEGYRGAHPKEFIIPADINKAKQFQIKGEGFIKLFTLAPESDPQFMTTRFFAESDVVVSAGHTNASLDELNAAIDNGLKTFTHLGNGSPVVLPRHNNIINRVLSLSDKIYISFISDGIHIPEFVLSNYLQIVGFERAIIISDSTAAASASPGTYSVSNINIEVGEDKIVRESGKQNLAGSAVTLKESQKILKKLLALEESDLNAILCENAKKLLNINGS